VPGGVDCKILRKIINVKWDKVYDKEEIEAVARLEDKGHSKDCAENIHWGDGNCICPIGGIEK